MKPSELAPTLFCLLDSNNCNMEVMKYVIFRCVKNCIGNFPGYQD